MSNIRENFDLDGDNNISGKDIDVLWAFLQTKTLAEKEWADNVAKAPTEPAGQPNMCNDNPIKCSPVDEDGNITQIIKKCGDSNKWRLEESFTDTGTEDCPPCCQFIPTNFIEKMLDLYQVNQDSGIAEDNTGNGATTEDQVSSYPGTLELGKKVQTPQVFFKRRWTLDDLPNITQIDSSDQDQTKSIESFTGKLSAELSNCTWEASGAGGNKFYVNLVDETSFIEFDDEGTLNSSDNWTLHFKAKMVSGRPDGPLIKKGNSELDFAHETALEFENFVNKKYYYQLPEGQSKTSLLSQTEVDFYLQRTTFGLKIFADRGTGAEEYPLSVVGVQVEIFSDSTTDKLRIMGNHISQVSDVWICDDSLDQKGILNISANKKLHNYKSYNTLDFTDESARFAFALQMKDKFDNFIRIYRTKDNVIDKFTLKTETGYFQPAPATMPFNAASRTNVCKLLSNKRYTRIENINMKGNFTISFFLKTGQSQTARPLFTIENLDPTKRVIWYMRNSSYDELIMKGEGLSNIWFGKIQEDLSVMKTTLTHFTLVKNRNLIGLWINGNYKRTYEITDADLSTIGTEARFSLYGGHWAHRCADIVYMNYADSHVPVSGKFDSGTFDFIQNDMVIKEI